MKKLFACLALMGLLATPAMAELVAMPAGSAVGVDIPLDGGVGPRTVPYSGGVGEVYDNLPSQVGGPSNVAFAWGVGAGVWMLDDVQSMAGTTFTHAHMLVQGFVQTGQLHSHIVAYYSNNAANSHVGTILLTTGGGPAAFLYTGLVGPPAGYAQFWSLGHPAVVAPNGAMWMGLNSLNGLSYWGNAGTTPPGIGTSNPAVMAVPGITVTPIPNSSPFFPVSLVPNTTGNMNWAVGVPEPTTIAVLAIGGLLALRRRKA